MLQAATSTDTPPQLDLIFERYIARLVNRQRKPVKIADFRRVAVLPTDLVNAADRWPVSK
jgi:hypothetical protein